MLNNVQDMLTNHNYSHQRAALQKSFDQANKAYGKMVIPFLGMIQKDLEKIDLIPNACGDGSINKWKYYLISKVVSSVISQTRFDSRCTVRYEEIYQEMEELYERVQNIERKGGTYIELDKITDEYVKIERGKMLCNQSVRSKLLWSTLMNVLAWITLWVMFDTYIKTSRKDYMVVHLMLFFGGNVMCC